MPFITEEIGQHLPGAGRSVSVAPFPEARPEWADAEAEKAMTLLQEVIVETRKLRTENKIAPKAKIELWVKSPGDAETQALARHAALLQTLAGVSKLEFAAAFPAGRSILKGVAGPFELAIPFDAAAGLAGERERIEKELQRIGTEIAKLEGKLANTDFTARAPRAVVDENRTRLEGLRDRRGKLEANLAALIPAA
jgi:valyl-tRNA synthetase